MSSRRVHVELQRYRIPVRYCLLALMPL